MNCFKTGTQPPTKCKLHEEKWRIWREEKDIFPVSLKNDFKLGTDGACIAISITDSPWIEESAGSVWFVTNILSSHILGVDTTHEIDGQKDAFFPHKCYFSWVKTFLIIQGFSVYKSRKKWTTKTTDGNSTAFIRHQMLTLNCNFNNLKTFTNK